MTIDLDKVFRAKRKRLVKMMTRMMRGDVEAAEDIVQDAFLKAWQFRKKYNPDKGRVEPWLNGILFNCFRNHLKEKLNRDKYIVQVNDMDVFLDESEEWDDEDKFLSSKIAKVKNEKHRSVLTLHFVLGYDSAEIESIVEGMTQSNVTTIVSRFKEKVI